MGEVSLVPLYAFDGNFEDLRRVYHQKAGLPITLADLTLRQNLLMLDSTSLRSVVPDINEWGRAPYGLPPTASVRQIFDTDVYGSCSWRGTLRQQL